MSVLNRICKDKSLAPSWVKKMASKAPYSYKKYTIPKNTGGHRLIAQPAKETKYLQYWVLDNIIRNLPIHSCANAYLEGRSIKTNASQHKDNRFLAKFDFKNFFPSITAEDFICHLNKYGKDEYSEDDIELLTKILFIADKHMKNYHLSIGAPTSPALSNTILFDFDKMLAEHCESQNITYTRYADDLAFSTNEKNKLFELPEIICSTINQLKYPQLSLHPQKQVFTSKRFNRTITGIVISNEGKLSLGRKRKRKYSSLIHKFKLGLLSDAETRELAGTLAFCQHIEPDFIERMKNKYGADVVASIQQHE